MCIRDRGKPKGKVNAKYSLSQIVDAVYEKLGVPVQFAPDCAKAGDAAAALKPGWVKTIDVQLQRHHQVTQFSFRHHED